jgi:hypothetical protein
LTNTLRVWSRNCKNGALPLQIACENDCSSEVVTMLVEASLQAIVSKNVKEELLMPGASKKKD